MADLTDFQAEQRFLGALLRNAQLLGENITFADRAFTHDGNRSLFELLRSTWLDGYPVSPEDLQLRCSRLDGQGSLRQDALVACLKASSNSTTHVVETVKHLRDLYHRREVLASVRKLHQQILDLSNPVDGKVLDHVDDVMRLMQDDGDEAQSLQEVGVERIKDLQSRPAGYNPGIPVGFNLLDDNVCVCPGQVTIVAARPSVGKAQAMHSKVLTMSGWKTMRDLKVGEPLASIDGAESRVVAIHPQGQQQTYRVTFADGRSTLATGEHRWEIGGSRLPRARIVTTNEVARLLKCVRHGRHRLYTRLSPGFWGNQEAHLPIDPYLLGLLLGDGCLTGGTPSFSTADPEMVESIQERLDPGDGLLIHQQGVSYNYRISQKNKRFNKVNGSPSPNPLMAKLRTLGLAGLGSLEKFIPQIYLSANHHVRLELLRGLLDTDGTVQRGSGTVRYSTSSKRLAGDVRQLAWSLGATCSMGTKKPWYPGKNGERVLCADNYIIGVRHPTPWVLFRLERKRNKIPRTYRQKKQNVGVAIMSVEEASIEECRCITVSHPTGLYITDDYLVTHNSALGQQMSLYAAKTGRTGLLCSPEMSAAEVIDRLIAQQSGFPLQALRTGQIRTAQSWDKIADGVTRFRNLYIFDQTDMSSQDIAIMARRLHARQKLNFIMVDYLQFLNEEDGGKTPRPYQIARSIRRLKGIARTLNIGVICLAQLNRNVVDKDGIERRPTLADLGDSGAIERDADVVIAIYHTDESMADGTRVAELIVLKNRNGDRGTEHALWHPSRTTFQPIVMAAQAPPAAPLPEPPTEPEQQKLGVEGLGKGQDDVIVCETCGGLGIVYVSEADGTDTEHAEPCPKCDGTLE